MLLTRQKITDGSATAKALDYSLKRWVALTRFVDDGRLPADNNWIENQIRPIAIGRSNWLFAGSLRAGKRAAAVMSLIRRPSSTGMTRTPISRMCWRGCPRSAPARSTSCCPTAGFRRSQFTFESPNHDRCAAVNMGSPRVYI
jgi:hypothetical protein